MPLQRLTAMKGTRTMRKTISAALVTAGTLALTACGNTDTGESAPATVTETTTAPSTMKTTISTASDPRSSTIPWGELDGTLLHQMKLRGIPTGNMTNANVVSTGEAACMAMDNDVEPRVLLDLVVEEMPMWDLADSLLYLELSFTNLCPEHATI